MVVAENDAVTAAVDKLVSRHPETARLLTLAGPDYYPTRAIIDALDDAALPGPVKGQVIRLLLGANTLDYRDPMPVLTDALYRRHLVFLMEHPLSPIEEKNLLVQREWPGPLWSYWLDSRPRNTSALFNAMVITPYMRMLAGERIHPDLLEISETTKQMLASLFQYRVLTHARAEQAIEDGFNTPHAVAYFATSCEALNIRNGMVFAEVILQRESAAGADLQNRIPIALSSLFGIRRLSMPELRLVADLLGLVIGKAISPDSWRIENPEHTRIIEMLKYALDNRHLLDIEERASRLRELHQITPGLANSFAEGRSVGQYHSGFVFNTDRLITGTHHFELLSDFNLFYRHVDTEQLRILLTDGAESAGYRRFLRKHEAQWAGIRQRDLLNILLFGLERQSQGEDPAATLPSVARYALGQPEPNVGIRRQDKFARARKSSAKGSFTAVPQIDVLIRSAQSDVSRSGYLLHTSYIGELPDDMPVFLPRAVAAGFTSVPDSVVLVGLSRVPWGVSPYSADVLPDVVGWDLTPLR